VCLVTFYRAARPKCPTSLASNGSELVAAAAGGAWLIGVPRFLGRVRASHPGRCCTSVVGRRALGVVGVYDRRTGVAE